jgi:hypothetical protein
MDGFVYLYNDVDSGLIFYWYNDVEGEFFYSSITLASVFSEREIRVMNLDENFIIGDSFFSPELNSLIIIKEELKKVNIKDI